MNATSGRGRVTRPDHNGPRIKRKWRRLLAKLGALAAALGLVAALGQRGTDWVAGKVADWRGDKGFYLTAGIDQDVVSDGFAAVWPGGKGSYLPQVPSNAEGCSIIEHDTVTVGGFDAGQSDVLVTSQGLSSPVLITGIHARVLSREDPPTGDVLTCEGGGVDDAAPMGLDLSEEHPLAREIDEDTLELGKAYFATHAISLKPAESQPITVMAQAGPQVVRWQLDVTAVVDGEEKTFLLPEDSKDAFTTGPYPTSDTGGDYFTWLGKWVGPSSIVDPYGDL